MKPKSLQDHLKTIQSMGGKALYKKVGRAGMRRLAQKAWAKRKPKGKVEGKKIIKSKK